MKLGRQKHGKQLFMQSFFCPCRGTWGNVLKWVSTYYKNHWLDAAYMALVGQSILSVGDTQPRTFQLPEGARRG